MDTSSRYRSEIPTTSARCLRIRGVQKLRGFYEILFTRSPWTWGNIDFIDTRNPDFAVVLSDIPFSERHTTKKSLTFDFACYVM